MNKRTFIPYPRRATNTPSQWSYWAPNGYVAPSRRRPKLKPPKNWLSKNAPIANSTVQNASNRQNA